MAGESEGSGARAVSGDSSDVMADTFQAGSDVMYTSLAEDCSEM